MDCIEPGGQNRIPRNKEDRKQYDIFGSVLLGFWELEGCLLNLPKANIQIWGNSNSVYLLLTRTFTNDAYNFIKFFM